MPVEIVTETLALVGIELKLIAELHEVYGMRAPGSAAEPRRRSAARRERVLQAAIAAICERAAAEIRPDARALGGDVNVLGAFGVVEGDEVLLRLISPLRPGLLQPVEGEDFRYLVMPIRLNV